ncbi:MAG: S-methyl-5-thioribose kinase, partial [Bacilli bacterium]
FALEPGIKKKQVVQFTNPELCKITEDLIFTDPFHYAETNNYPVELQSDVEDIWNDFLLKLEVAKLKHKFLTQSEALLHGDLHTGSVFVKEDSTKVIDPEFAYYGPMGFDVGNYIGNLILNFISQEGHVSDKNKRKQIQEYLLQAIKDTWSEFTLTFQQLWQERGLEPYTKIEGYCGYFLNGVFVDAIGFAGCEVIRRTIGLAHVEDIESVPSEEKKLAIKKQALSIGRKLIIKRNTIQNIDELLNLVKG